MATPTPIPAFAPVLKPPPLPLDGSEVPVCDGADEDFVADEDEEDVVCIGVEPDEVEEEVVAEVVTAVDPTEKVVERSAGAGSSNIWFVGEPQLTVASSASVPQQAQTCDALL
jgi:hypothetical protein